MQVLIHLVAGGYEDAALTVGQVLAAVVGEILRTDALSYQTLSHLRHGFVPAWQTDTIYLSAFMANMTATLQNAAMSSIVAFSLRCGLRGYTE